MRRKRFRNKISLVLLHGKTFFFEKLFCCKPNEYSNKQGFVALQLLQDQTISDFLTILPFFPISPHTGSCQRLVGPRGAG